MPVMNTESLTLGPHVAGTFVARRNRFVALVEVAGAVVEAHVPTSSRMRELLVVGAPVVLVARGRPGRATAYDLVMAYYGETLVSIDSRVPNRLLDRVLRARALPALADWTFARPEVALGESRLDFLLTEGERRCWVEAKSVTLVEEGMARFPDAPTARGARHLGELAAACDAGDAAAAVFIIQREDARSFTPHHALDPVFARALAEARAHGVQVLAYTCHITPERIALGRRVEVVLP